MKYCICKCPPVVGHKREVKVAPIIFSSSRYGRMLETLARTCRVVFARLELVLPGADATLAVWLSPPLSLPVRTADWIVTRRGREIVVGAGHVRLSPVFIVHVM